MLLLFLLIGCYCFLACTFEPSILPLFCKDLSAPRSPQHPPELHEAADQRQGDEVFAAVLAVVEQQPAELHRAELHGDAHRVVRLHHLEGQVGLATEAGDEVPDSCKSRG